MYGYIYKTTNLLNNKIYIGQHKSSQFDESYYGSGKLLKLSMKKNGIENFSVEVLEWCHSEDELNEREVYYIDCFNSTNKSIGYNITQGGYGCRGYVFTDDVRQAIGEKSREHNLMRDKEIYDKVSQSHIGSKMMTNGSEQRWVHSGDIETMKTLGWVVGHCKRRNRDYNGKNNTMYGKSAVKGRKWLHKYDAQGKLVREYVFEDKLNSYIQSGWEMGMK